MYTFDNFFTLVSEEIKALNMPSEPALLYDPIRYTLEEGGKRIRPVGLLIAYDIFGRNIREAIPAALAVEVFHNFTLLHDDIMDEAPTRRGRPVVYKKWDENIAILSGDAMMIYAYQLLAKSPAGKLGAVLKTFNDVSIGVCEGQSFDMEFEAKESVSVGEYMKMIGLKTAILIAGALKIGAQLGGASEHEADIFYRFGFNIGLAFQIQDDLLDIYADEETFGKIIGGDIIAGKKTFLLTNAFALADKETKAEMVKLLREDSPTGREKIIGIKEIYRKLDIRELAEQTVNRYFEMALSLINTLDIKPEKLVALKEYADILLNRKK